MLMLACQGRLFIPCYPNPFFLGEDTWLWEHRCLYSVGWAMAEEKNATMFDGCGFGYAVCWVHIFPGNMPDRIHTRILRLFKAS